MLLPYDHNQPHPLLLKQKKRVIPCLEQERKTVQLIKCNPTLQDHCLIFSVYYSTLPSKLLPFWLMIITAIQHMLEKNAHL